jgi:uncharacterized protein (TIGR02246 family)
MTSRALLRHRRQPHLIVGSIIITACASPSPDVETVKAEIAEARSAFWEAHEQGDAEALASAVTEDAVLLAPGMDDVRGRDALREAARQMFSAWTIEDFTIVEQEMRIHLPFAYELATYTETIRIADSSPRLVRGRYLLIWHKDDDGVWRVDRNMFHFITPAPF